MSYYPHPTCYPISRVEETKASAIAGAFSVSQGEIGASVVVGAWSLVPQVYRPAVGRLTWVRSMFRQEPGCPIQALFWLEWVSRFAVV